MGSLELSSGWLLVITALLIYCAVQTFRDFRRHRYLMAGVGVFCLALILLMPIRTHAVKYDLQIASLR